MIGIQKEVNTFKSDRENEISISRSKSFVVLDFTKFLNTI